MKLFKKSELLRDRLIRSLGQGYTLSQFIEQSGESLEELNNLIMNDEELQRIIVSSSKLLDTAYTLRHVHGDPRAFTNLERHRLA